MTNLSGSSQPQVESGFAETLNFYIRGAENGFCRVPRQKMVEIQAALARLADMHRDMCGVAGRAEDELLSLRRKVEETEAERDEARTSWKQAIDLYEMEVKRVDPLLRKVEEQRRVLEISRDSVITGCDTISTLDVIARALAGDRP